MQLNKISPKVIIPAVLLATGSMYTINTYRQKNEVSGKQTMEFLDKNPYSQASKAGLLLNLFGFFRKKKEEVSDAEKTDDNIPKFSGTIPENSELNISKFGYPVIDKNTEYAVKVDFSVPEGSTITYPDGKTMDLAEVFVKEGMNIKPCYTNEIFIKDNNGNIFNKYKNYINRKEELIYVDMNKNKNKYYALSEDGELFSVDLTKIPAGKEFAVNRDSITRKIVVPKGTTINYDGNTLIADEGSDYCTLAFYTGDKKGFFTSQIFHPRMNVYETTDSVSEQRKNEINDKLLDLEQKEIEKLRKEIVVDDRKRNMTIQDSYTAYEYCTAAEKESVTDDEACFYKMAYDYFVKNYPEYKDCHFIFKRRNSTYTMIIKNGEQTLKEINGFYKSTDGPIFLDSRGILSLGEFKKVFPKD